jgi:hypothetical protein
MASEDNEFRSFGIRMTDCKNIKMTDNHISANIPIEAINSSGIVAERNTLVSLAMAPIKPRWHQTGTGQLLISIVVGVIVLAVGHYLGWP